MARAEAQPLAGEAEGGAIGLITAACRHVALLAALLAMGGSLFFSEVLGWLPCQLCWYQRILMYPLTLLLLVGILRRDRSLHFYVLPLSLAGMAVSLYHYLEVMKLIEPSPCVGAVPCSIDYLTGILTGPLGFIKIPFLALVAFTIISIMMGNFALAGDEALPTSPRGESLARWSALGLVVATVLLFGGLGAAI
jgi:disulfide bond formation protein DsbB